MLSCLPKHGCTTFRSCQVTSSSILLVLNDIPPEVAPSDTAPTATIAEAHARAKANQGWDAAASKTTCWLAMRTLASFVFFCHERASSSYTRRDRRSGLIELGYEMRSAGLGRYRKLAKRSVADTSSSATDKPAARGLGALGRSETWPGKESAGL
jgi:hypothetical protein